MENRNRYLAYTIIIMCLSALPVISNINAYNVYNPSETEVLVQDDNSDKILFIVDFSNSMNDYIGSSKKIDVAVNTLASIASKLPPGVKTGLRVYGHKFGFNPLMGCSATDLVSPVLPNNTSNIYGILSKMHATGWTPITRSLKQAVNHDFAGIPGKKRIILLTDGGENCDESPCEYAINLVQMRDDIRIDVIAFALDDDVAEAQLKCTALATFGKMYHANDANSLANSLEKALNVTTEVQGTIIKK